MESAPLLCAIAHKKVRQIITRKRGTNRETELHHHRVFQIGDGEDVDQRADEDDGRHEEAKEHEGDQRSLTAIAGAGQLFLHARRFEELFQLQIVERALHEADRRRAERSAPRAAGLRERLALLLAQFLAPLGDGFHSNFQRAALEIGQSEGQNRGERGDRAECRDQEFAFEKEAPIAELVHVSVPIRT